MEEPVATEWTMPPDFADAVPTSKLEGELCSVLVNVLAIRDNSVEKAGEIFLLEIASVTDVVELKLALDLSKTYEILLVEGIEIGVSTVEPNES